jgi:putative FmdB family regulatory protein
MPIYEYRCEHCGVFEEMQRITAPPLARCPTCQRKVRRLISSTSFQLKGSGWYVTDYARGGSGDGGKKDDAKPAGTAETPKSDTKTEAKPASSSSTSSEKPAS